MKYFESLVFLVLFIFLGVSFAQPYPPRNPIAITQSALNNNFRRFDTTAVFVDFWFPTILDNETNILINESLTTEYANGRSFINFDDETTFRRFRSVFYPVVDEFTLLQIPEERYGLPSPVGNPYSLGDSSTGGFYRPADQEVMVTVSIGNFSTTRALDIDGNRLDITERCNPAFQNGFYISQGLNDTGLACDGSQGPRWWRYPFQGVDGTSPFFASFFSLVINIRGGEIRSLVWDDSCSECGGSDITNAECINTFVCGLNPNDNVNCRFSPFLGANTTAASGDTNCSPRIFLSWSGTDRNDDECTSFSSSPSQFSLYSAAPVFRAASQSTQASFI